MSDNSALKDVAVKWPGCGHTAWICCAQCYAEQAAELAELRLANQTRPLEFVIADGRWRNAHPKQELPEAGAVLEWLLGELNRLERLVAQANSALPRGWQQE